MVKLETKVDKVSIYRNGAEVVRTGKAELEAGSQSLQVLGLTGSALPDTARLFATGGLSCSNMRVAYPQYGEESEEFHQLEDKVELIGKKIEARELQLKLWKDNGDFSGKDGQASDVESYIEKLADRIMALEEDIIRLRKEKYQLEVQKTKLSDKESLPSLMVDVEAPAAGCYSFELRYHENFAQWSPVYEIHSDGKEAMELKLRANIQQNTVEDWENVEISLFTGNPSASGRLPELKTVYLDIRTPQPAVYGRAKAAPAMGMMMASMANAAPMAMEDTMAVEEADMEMAAPMRIETKSAEVKSGETMTEYALAGRRDLPKAGNGIMADLQSNTLPVEYRIAAVPAADLSAYLTARVKTGDLPINQAITAGIYLDGMYTGELRLDPDLTKEYVDITLGKEEKIKISHKELARKSSNTLLKGLKVVEYSFETKAANLTEEEQTVYISDRIPVSQNKDISVEAVELSGSKADEETGFIDWTLKLAPGASETIRLGYKVSRPKDKEISERVDGGAKFCPTCGARVYGKFCPECGSIV